MQEKILQTASQLFLSLGFKSVTMDDIAEKMGISKKTIYEYYKNKNDLVEATTHFVFEQITTKVDTICCKDCGVSPIQTLFDINSFMNEHLKEDNAPEYQLQKYYPEIYTSLTEKKFIAITNGIKENLERGIEFGLYRDDIDVEVVSRLYFSIVSSIKNSKIFPKESFKISELMHSYLLYHIRAIATPKGLQELENYLQNNNKVR
jgi:AcrR family transcriptional regulator